MDRSKFLSSVDRLEAKDFNRDIFVKSKMRLEPLLTIPRLGQRSVNHIKTEINVHQVRDSVFVAPVRLISPHMISPSHSY